MTIRAAVWSIAVWLVCVDSATAEIRRRAGCAHDRSTGEVLYAEIHEERFHQSGTMIERDPRRERAPALGIGRVEGRARALLLALVRNTG